VLIPCLYDRVLKVKGKDVVDDRSDPPRASEARVQRRGRHAILPVQRLLPALVFERAK
jgi:hypothetical protein